MYNSRKSSNNKISRFGQIPSTWEIKKLDKCFNYFNCQSKEDGEFEVFTSSQKGLIRQSDYYGANRITRRETKGFNIIPNKYLTYRSRSDSNLFHFNQNKIGETGLVSKFYPVFTSKDGIEANQFFVLLLNYYSSILAQQGVGTSQVVLSYNALKNVKLPIPPLPEQKRIGEIISCLDKLIKNLKLELNALNNLYESILNKVIESLIREGVKKLYLGELVDPNRKITYGIVQAGHHLEKGVPYIRVSDMQCDFLSPDNMLRTSRELADKFKRSEVKLNDLVVALRGNVGLSHVINKSCVGANLTQGTALISSSEKFVSTYLNHVLKSIYCKQQFNRFAKGSTFVEISLKSLSLISVPIPSIERQEYFSNLLDAIKRNFFLKKKQLQKYKDMKQGISSDLISGHKRVNV